MPFSWPEARASTRLVSKNLMQRVQRRTPPTQHAPTCLWKSPLPNMYKPPMEETMRLHRCLSQRSCALRGRVNCLVGEVVHIHQIQPYGGIYTHTTLPDDLLVTKAGCLCPLTATNTLGKHLVCWTQRGQSYGKRAINDWHVHAGNSLCDNSVRIMRSLDICVCMINVSLPLCQPMLITTKATADRNLRLFGIPLWTE